MHTNRYLVHTFKNTPALIHYRLKALTRLVGRHSGRESGSTRLSQRCLSCANGHHAVHESLHGMTYREQSNSLYCVFHPQTKA